MIYRTLFGKVLFPAYHRVTGDGVSAVVSQLRKHQWSAPEALQEMQRRKLHRLLSHAVRTVPYYRQMMGDMQADERSSARWLREFPLLTKSVIRKNLADLISSDLTGNQIFETHTSGSTGESLLFYRDKRSLMHSHASVLIHQEWMDFFLGDRKLLLWGAPMDIGKAQSLRGKLHGLISGVRVLSSFALSPEIMDRYIEIIRDFKPRLLISYPGSLEVFAEHLEARGIAFPSLKAVVTSGEQLWEHQRSSIERILGVPVFNRYGSREMGDVGHECACHSGLHVNNLRYFVELLDDEGRSVPAGELGEITITDLENYGMPMIRYRIGDRAAWSKTATCACGRGFPLLSQIEGRSLDIIKAPNNRRLGGTFWTILLKSRPGIKQFQLRQDHENGITVFFVRDRDFDIQVLDAFESMIKDKCGHDFGVEFIEKDHIETTVSGKRRFIICNC